MLDADKSGGAVVDLQIHDIDYVSQILGLPIAITANGLVKGGGINAVYSQLIYPSKILVFVEASWLMPKSFPFRTYFKMTFEGAVLEMDSWRPEGQYMKIFPIEGDAYFPELKLVNPYHSEIEYFANQLSRGLAFDEVPLEESVRSLHLCLASEQSCQLGTRIAIE
jgi:predicted dehydrogenase